MQYIENPKTKGSGIICAIPQKGECPNKCQDCFFQSGRSYLEPLDKNLPNIPTDFNNRIVKVNDGNDSNVNQDEVIEMTKHFPNRFYNTAIPRDLEKFEMPVVLTINPGIMTDREFSKLELIPKNLMFVRFRTNAWNKQLLTEAVEFYSKKEVPIVLTFMAYFNHFPKEYEFYQWTYTYRKRTLNSYYAITTNAWEYIMFQFKYNKYVYSCGKIEGELGTTLCKHCGNCLREYYATLERIRK